MGDTEAVHDTMRDIRVISLDLDDTLWPVGPVITAAEAAVHEWLCEHHPRAMQGQDESSMRQSRLRIAERHPELRHDLTLLRARALEEQFAAAGYHDSDAAAQALEIFLAARNRVNLYDDVRPALERLRSRYRLFAVSNGNADLARCGLAGSFEGHVSAAAVGAAKPDPRIFASLVRAAGVEPQEILHVGDDPAADVIGALRAGLKAAWLNREGRAWPEGFAPPPRTVTTLAEL